MAIGPQRLIYTEGASHYIYINLIALEIRLEWRVFLIEEKLEKKIFAFVVCLLAILMVVTTPALAKTVKVKGKKGAKASVSVTACKSSLKVGRNVSVKVKSTYKKNKKVHSLLGSFTANSSNDVVRFVKQPEGSNIQLFYGHLFCKEAGETNLKIKVKMPYKTKNRNIKFRFKKVSLPVDVKTKN